MASTMGDNKGKEKKEKKERKKPQMRQEADTLIIPKSAALNVRERQCLVQLKVRGPEQAEHHAVERLATGDGVGWSVASGGDGSADLALL